MELYVYRTDGETLFLGTINSHSIYMSVTEDAWSCNVILQYILKLYSKSMITVDCLISSCVMQSRLGGKEKGWHQGKLCIELVWQLCTAFCSSRTDLVSSFFKVDWSSRVASCGVDVLSSPDSWFLLGISGWLLDASLKLSSMVGLLFAASTSGVLSISSEKSGCLYAFRRNTAKLNLGSFASSSRSFFTAICG